MDSAQVCIFKEPNKVCLRSLLQGKHSGSLESQIRLVILGNLTNQALEGKLSDKQVSRLLVPTDLTESDSSRAAVGIIGRRTTKQLAMNHIEETSKAEDGSLTHYRWGFLTPPVAGALLRAALVASCLRGAFPPVDLRAVCFVRAIVSVICRRHIE